MIKSAIYLVAICLMLTGCEQSSSPDRQLTLANQGLLSADLASDGKQAIVSSLSQGTVVWDLEQGKERWRWRQSDNPDNFIIITRFSADDSHAVTATPDSFGIWRLQDGQSQGYYSLPESRLRDIALSADGRQVLIGREDGKAEVVDTRTGRRLQFLGHTEQVNTVDLSPNGRYALTAATTTAPTCGIPAPARWCGASTTPVGWCWPGSTRADGSPSPPTAARPASGI